MKKAEALKEIEGMFKFAPDWIKEVPESAAGDIWGLLKDVQLQKTAIPNKYKELIGLAMAATIKCRYCIFFHTEADKANGATDDEIKEALLMGGATNLFSTWINGSEYDFDKFKRETLKMLGK